MMILLAFSYFPTYSEIWSPPDLPLHHILVHLKMSQGLIVVSQGLNFVNVIALGMLNYVLYVLLAQIPVWIPI